MSGLARDFLFYEKSTMVLEFIWLLIQWTPDTLFQVVKWKEREADYLSLCSADV
jgi:hypothetical protein